MRAFLPTIILAFSIAAITACATHPVAPPSTYEQLGGKAGVEGIVDDLLEKILDDKRINFQFAHTDIVRFREKLIEQICYESGGQCVYTGHSMQEAHAGRHIDDVQFNALVEDLQAVMEARHVPVVAQNRLLKQLAPMHRDIVSP